MAKPRTQQHSVREKARKRTKSLFRKANELAQLTDANVYVVIGRNGKLQIYRSTNQHGWPPSEEEMVRSLYTDIQAFLNNMKSGQAFSNTTICISS